MIALYFAFCLCAVCVFIGLSANRFRLANVAAVLMISVYMVLIVVQTQRMPQPASCPAITSQ